MSENDKLTSNAEYQRRRMMSEDDRTIISRDIMSKNLHEQNQRDNKRTTYEDAQRKVVQIIEREERKK